MKATDRSFHMNNEKFNKAIYNAVITEIGKKISPEARENAQKSTALSELMYIHWKQYYNEVSKIRLDYEDIKKYIKTENRNKKAQIEVIACKQVREIEKGMKDFDKIMSKQFDHLNDISEESKDKLGAIMEDAYKIMNIKFSNFSL